MLFLVLGHVSLAACATDLPFAIPEFIPPGKQWLFIGSVPPGVEATARVTRDDVVVSTAETAVTASGVLDGPPPDLALELDMPSAGQVTVTVELRHGAATEQHTRHYVVHEPLILTNRLPRPCLRFAPLSDAEFDCDGTIVDVAGEAVPGRPGAAQTIVLREQSGFRRWLLDATQLRVETPDGVSDPITVSVAQSQSWVAAHDFAVTDDALVLLSAGALTSVPFDKGEHARREAIAAATRASARSIVYRDEAGLWVCAIELATDLSQASLGSCLRIAGLAHQERLSTGKLVVTRQEEPSGVGWLDLFHPEDFSSVYNPADHDLLALGRYPGFPVLFSRSTSPRLLVPLIPGLGLYQVEGPASGKSPLFPWEVHSADEYVWAVADFEGTRETWWARVPE